VLGVSAGDEKLGKKEARSSGDHGSGTAMAARVRGDL
jgi:hypothetical protein